MSELMKVLEQGDNSNTTSGECLAETDGHIRAITTLDIRLKMPYVSNIIVVNNMLLILRLPI